MSEMKQITDMEPGDASRCIRTCGRKTTARSLSTSVDLMHIIKRTIPENNLTTNPARQRRKDFTRNRP